MNFKNLFFAVSILFITISFNSCSENEGNLAFLNPQCFGFTKEELKNVGKMHNEYVTSVYQTVDFRTCQGCDLEVINEFSKIDINLSQLEKTKEELILESKVRFEQLKDISFDLRQLNNHKFSQNSFDYLSQLMEEMDKIENYDDFVTNLVKLQSNIDEDISLSCFDWELLTGTIEVAKASVYLWLPKSLGGLDYYQLAHNGQIGSRWSWRNAAKADVAESATYFLGLGIGAAAGLFVPGSNVAILGGWALSAGLSSALGGLI